MSYAELEDSKMCPGIKNYSVLLGGKIGAFMPNDLVIEQQRHQRGIRRFDHSRDRLCTTVIPVSISLSLRSCGNPSITEYIYRVNIIWVWRFKPRDLFRPLPYYRFSRSCPGTITRQSREGGDTHLNRTSDLGGTGGLRDPESQTKNLWHSFGGR
jgi:hypothetical protein